MYKSGIYCIRNEINGKRYIGSAVNLSKRKREHWNNTASSKHLQNAINKYGIDSFIFYVLEYVQDLNKLIEREQYHIDIYDFEKHLYNICPIAGSPLGSKRSDKDRKKRSKGVHLFCKDTGKLVRKFISQNDAGKFLNVNRQRIFKNISNPHRTINGYYIRHGDVEVITQQQLNKLKNHNIKPALKLSKKVKCFNIKTKQLINTFDTMSSAAKKNNININNVLDTCNGKQLTVKGLTFRYFDKYPSNVLLEKEYKNIHEKSFIVGPKRVLQINKDTNSIVKIFNSITQASLELNISRPHISAVCRNKRKTCGGFKWVYAD